MTLTLEVDLEAALNEQARRQGVAAEVLAVKALREHFLARTAYSRATSGREASLKRRGTAACLFPTLP